MSAASPGHCSAASALYAATGGEPLFSHYARKLLIRRWAGTMSPVERAYVRAHRSEAQQRQAEGAAARLRLVRSPAVAPKHRLQRAVRPERDAEAAHARR